MLPFLADDLRHLPRRPPATARSRGILRALPQLPCGAELRPVASTRTELGWPLRRLSHAGADVEDDPVDVARPGHSGAGTHPLDQGLPVVPAAMTAKPPAGNAHCSRL